MVDFLGIGAQKAGTTWMFLQLSRHPQIAFPAGKELHFWNRFDPALAGHWAAMLEPSSRRCPAGRPIRSGEITPAYAILPLHTIQHIHRCCPDARLFISLRNPLERAWSAAVMDLRRGGRAEEDVSDAWFLDHFHSAESLARGDYLGCLERWWSVFPREQLLVLLYDTIRHSPAEALTRLARHLDVDTDDFADIPPADLTEVVVPELGPDSRREDQPPLSIPERLQPALREIYGSAIHRLADAVGWDLTAWLEPPRRNDGGNRLRRVVRTWSDSHAELHRLSAAPPPAVG